MANCEVCGKPVTESDCKVTLSGKGKKIIVYAHCDCEPRLYPETGRNLCMIAVDRYWGING